MGVRVSLTISGLCMYVPGGKSDPSVLHVLMPSHRKANAADRESQVEHTAQLVVDRRYLDPHDLGDAELCGGQCLCVSLNGCAVQVKGRGVAAPLPPRVDPNCVARLGPAENFPGVDPACLNWPLHPHVQARLVLAQVGSPHEPEDYGWLGKPRKRCLVPPKGKCSATHKPQAMAEHVRWDLGPFEDGVKLTDYFTRLPDTTPPDVPDVRLRAHGGRVELRLAYAVPGATTAVCAHTYTHSDLAKGHFEMFYALGVRDPSGPMFEPQPDGPHELDPGFMSPLYPSQVCNSATADLAGS